MELLRIHDQQEQYIFDVIVSYKIWGLRGLKLTRSFKKAKGNGQWYRSSGSKASSKEVRRLEHWLYNHEKFVVGSL